MRSLPYRIPTLEAIEAALPRFWSKVICRIDTGCWEWTGYINPSGYGMIHTPGCRRGTSIVAHRLILLYHSGIVESDLLACHRCDNPRCVRPDHLFWGSHRDNTHDAIDKGRFKFLGVRAGTRNPNAKITEAQAMEVIALQKSGMRKCDIMRATGLKEGLVAQIYNGVTWRHLPR